MKLLGQIEGATHSAMKLSFLHDMDNCVGHSLTSLLLILNLSAESARNRCPWIYKLPKPSFELSCSSWRRVSVEHFLGYLIVQLIGVSLSLDLVSVIRPNKNVNFIDPRALWVAREDKGLLDHKVSHPFAQIV